MMSYLAFQLKRSLKRFLLTPYVSPRRLANTAMVFLQFALKKPVVAGYPLKISFDPSSNCMLQCPLCPTGQGSRERTRGEMSLEKFKKLVDEVAPYIYEIDLNNWGEPFLNKHTVGMAAYAHKKRIKTLINTNLNVPLTEENAGSLIKAGLDTLYVSFDGITQKTYEKYRKKGKLSAVFANLKTVAKKKRELGSETPRIVWQFLVMKHNEHEVPMLEKVKKELGVNELVIGAVRSDMGKEVYVDDVGKVDDSRNWLPGDEKYSRYDYEKKSRKLKKKTCHFLWTVSVINWNGSVSPCCSVYKEKEDFGNAFEEGFKKVWNNEKYVGARKAIASMAPNGITVCDNCIRTGFVD